MRFLPLFCLALMATPALAQSNGDTHKITDSDRQFLAYVNEDNQAELQICQFAEQNARSPAVRAFARLMVDDHKEMANRLTDLVKREQIQLPAGMPQQTMAKITPKSGVNFDGDFIGAQVQHHSNDLQRFETVQSKTQDAGLRQFAAETAPILQQHLALAQAVAGSLGGQQTIGRGGAR